MADASPVGLGAVLVQSDTHGPRIIAYGNKTLTECERRYCQTEKEAYALVWAVEHFDIFLYGKEFELITDHKPLEFIIGQKSKPCARIERWVLRLQSYKYKVVYQPGKTSIADPLSRLCKPSIDIRASEDEIHIYQIILNSKPTAIALKDVTEFSRNDQEILRVKQGINSNVWDESIKAYKLIESELCFYEDILLRSNKIVIPSELRKAVLDADHEGHPGIVAMKGRLRSKVWWPRIDKDAENLVKTCKGCTLVSAPNPPNPMRRRELPTAPWIDVAIDLLGPLPSNDYLFVIVDYYSRYKEIKICRTITSTEIIKILLDIFSRLGYPTPSTTDNGNQFKSEEFKSFCKECGISVFYTSPFCPQQNGEVERQNRDILKRLRISQTEGKDWKNGITEYMMMYNSTPHSVTGKTPSELFLRRQFRDKIPSLLDINNKIEDSEVRDRDKEQKEKGKEYADNKRRATDHEIRVGEKVYIKNMIKRNKLSLTFMPTTHTVESSRNGETVVRNDETGQTYRRNIIHLKKVEGRWEAVPENKREGD